MSYNSNSNPICIGSKVYVAEGKFEQAMRKFKNKVQDSGLLIELRERECYEKPTTQRKRAANQARRRWQKKLEAEALPKKEF